MSLIKHKLSRALALARVLSKFFTKLLQRSIQALERSTTHRALTGTKPVLPAAAFSARVSARKTSRQCASAQSRKNDGLQIYKNYIQQMFYRTFIRQQLID
jgi:hypothetical protein